MTSWLPIVISAVFGGGGLTGGLVMLFRARSETRKTDADAAAVLSGSATTYANEVTAQATAAFLAADKARADAYQSQRDVARLTGRVDELRYFITRVSSCAGGVPCPLRPLVPEGLDVSDAPDPT